MVLLCMLDKSKTYYLCGPMTGYNKLNHSLFNSEAKRLREGGFTIINPAEIDSSPEGDYKSTNIDQLKKDLSMILMVADCLLVLPGWEFSYGAQAEVNLAKAIKLPIYPIELTVGDTK